MVQQLGAQMSVKMHFLNSRLDYFPDNCEEQRERFIKTFQSWRLGISATECQTNGGLLLAIET